MVFSQNLVKKIGSETISEFGDALKEGEGLTNALTNRVIRAGDNGIRMGVTRVADLLKSGQSSISDALN